MGMYAKLMSRITESSLMDEDIPVRYCFVMLLAVADPQGYAVGTDVALARRLNMPLEDFKRCIHKLKQPDPDSNSKEEEGRRVIDSDCERGYYLVNYTKYRDTRDEEQRREYMREYMRNYREGKGVTRVNKRKQRKPQLAKVDVEVKVDKPPIVPQGGHGGKTDNLPTSDRAKLVADIFHRKHTTPWSGKEIEAFKKLKPQPDEDFTLVAEFYEKSGHEFLRHDLLAFLNNFTGEVDKARKWKSKKLNVNGHKTAAQWRAEQQAMDAERERNATQS